MKKLPLSSTTLANWLTALVIVLVPFHAFLTIWGASLFGHYTLLRLWSAGVLLLLVVVCIYWLIRNKELRDWIFKNTIVRLIVLYVVLTVILGVVAILKDQVTLKALFYGLLVNLRFPAFFVTSLIVAQQSDWLSRIWPRLLLIPGAIVACFGILQYVALPHQFLSHFGYNAKTIVPIETINHNSHYIRVQSTLRGANPLGAYLVLMLGALTGLWTTIRRMWITISMFVVASLALLFSFSRSAWIGATMTIAFGVWLQLRTAQLRRISVAIAAVFVLILGGVFLILRHGTTIENALYHTDTHSTIAVSSNGAHLSALKQGIKDVVHQPFGAGPGTAGPASVYNGDHGIRIAENYYVQLAQEVGWTGLVLFVAISALMVQQLWHRRNTTLARILLISLLGLSFVNLLSHAWTDDTLAFIWWGLAGIALAMPFKRKSQNEI